MKLRHLFECVQFSGNRDVQIPLKGFVYSLKLKIEFAVLGRLVVVARSSYSGDSLEFRLTAFRQDRTLAG
jgi:hypothetical protein